MGQKAEKIFQSLPRIKDIEDRPLNTLKSNPL